MTAPQPPGPWPPPWQQEPPRAASPAGRRGAGMAVTGGILVVLAVVGIVLAAVLGVRGLSEGVASWPRVPATTGGTVQLTAAETYAVCEELRTGTPAVSTSAVRVTGPDGRVREVTAASGSSYSLGDVQGVQIGTLVTDVAGGYRVEPAGRAPVGHQLVFVPTGGFVGGIGLVLLGVFGGLLVGAVGLVLLIVGLVRRSRRAGS